MTSDIYETYLSEIEDKVEPRYVSIYHAVRNIPYGSTGIRNPVAVIENRRGSCSGKHMLLRDLLRLTDCEAEVITIHTHFNRAIPLAPSFPDDLATLIRDGEIDDYHHFVRARIDDQWLNLDATWQDALGAPGIVTSTERPWPGDIAITIAPITTANICNIFILFSCPKLKSKQHQSL
jgi:transglutaminase-like putative cysteine protease